MEDGDSRVEVLVRVRPVLKREEGTLTPVECIDEQTIRVNRSGGRTIECQFDWIFSPHASQSDVYERVRGVVDSVLAGYNGTIFTYGQTGTGKTHTMSGSLFADGETRGKSFRNYAYEDAEARPTHGLIPRAMDQIFGYISATNKSTDYVARASYIQIYNDQIYDLLTGVPGALPPPTPRTANFGSSGPLRASGSMNGVPLPPKPPLRGGKGSLLEIKEDGFGGVYVSGATQVPVSSAGDVMSLLAYGAGTRAVRHTELNANSSRSHTILQLSLEQSHRGQGGTPGPRVRSKLNLVDLAGSEKWRDPAAPTQAALKDRLAEMTAINSSLSALANCIYALAERGRTHIPYRDSKLTRLLQDSLGGNSRTVFIATVSPSELSVDETVATLKFADVARRVRVRPELNADGPQGADPAAVRELAARLMAQQRRVYEEKISMLTRVLEAAERRAATETELTESLELENGLLREQLAEAAREAAQRRDEAESLQTSLEEERAAKARLTRALHEALALQEQLHTDFAQGAAAAAVAAAHARAHPRTPSAAATASTASRASLGGYGADDSLAESEGPLSPGSALPSVPSRASGLSLSLRTEALPSPHPPPTAFSASASLSSAASSSLAPPRTSSTVASDPLPLPSPSPRTAPGPRGPRSRGAYDYDAAIAQWRASLARGDAAAGAPAGPPGAQAAPFEAPRGSYDPVPPPQPRVSVRRPSGGGPAHPALPALPDTPPSPRSSRPPPALAPAPGPAAPPAYHARRALAYPPAGLPSLEEEEPPPPPPQPPRQGPGAGSGKPPAGPLRASAGTLAELKEKEAELRKAVAHLQQAAANARRSRGLGGASGAGVSSSGDLQKLLARTQAAMAQLAAVTGSPVAEYPASPRSRSASPRASREAGLPPRPPPLRSSGDGLGSARRLSPRASEPAWPPASPAARGRPSSARASHSASPRRPTPPRTPSPRAPGAPSPSAPRTAGRRGARRAGGGGRVAGAAAAPSAAAASSKAPVGSMIYVMGTSRSSLAARKAATSPRAPAGAQPAPGAAPSPRPISIAPIAPIADAARLYQQAAAAAAAAASPQYYPPFPPAQPAYPSYPPAATYPYPSAPVAYPPPPPESWGSQSGGFWPPIAASPRAPPRPPVQGW